MKMLLVMLSMMINLQPATVHKTYDDIVCFETRDGNLYECYGYVEDHTADYLLVMVDGQIIEFVQQ